MTGSGKSLLNDLCRTLLSAFSTVLAFRIVDRRNIVCYMDSIAFALSLAHLAADTACGTYLLNRRTFVLVHAADCILAVVRDDLDQVLRADGNASAAGLARIAVYTGNTVYDMDRIEWAGLDAGTETKASVITCLIADTAGNSSSAVFNTYIFCLIECFITVTSTAHIRNLSSAFNFIYTHDTRDLCSNGSAAYGTAVYGSFALGNGFSHGIAACVAAAAAVIARQAFADSCLTGINLDFKFLAYDDKHKTDQKAYNSNQDCSYQNRCHDIPPLQCQP